MYNMLNKTLHKNYFLVTHLREAHWFLIEHITQDLQKSGGVVTVGLGSISRENIAPVVIKDQESITSEEKQTEATRQGENAERYKEKEEGNVLDLIKSNEEQKPVSHLESDTENDRTRLKAEITHLNTQVIKQICCLKRCFVVRFH